MINTSDIKNKIIRLVISATKKEIKKNLVEKKSRLRLFYEINKIFYHLVHKKNIKNNIEK